MFAVGLEVGMEGDGRQTRQMRNMRAHCLFPTNFTPGTTDRQSTSSVLQLGILKSNITTAVEISQRVSVQEALGSKIIFVRGCENATSKPGRSGKQEQT